MEINPIAFQLGSLAVRWYGILVTAGFAAGVLVALRVSVKYYRWKEDDILDFALFLIPAAVIGARAYYVAMSWPEFSGDVWRIFKIWTGGLAVYGGIIAGVLVAFIYCRVKKKDVWDLLDIGMPAIALGQAIGRWGNFVNQEAYGRVVSDPNLQWFPFAVPIQADGQWHYATFFYESLWCLLIFVFLMFMRKKFRHKGDMALSYLLLYGLERAFVEGLRTDSLYVGPFRISQVLSMAVVAAVLVFVLVRCLRERGQSVRITNKAHPGYLWPPEEPQGAA